MRYMNGRRRLVFLVAGATVLAGSCTGASGDKAGGSGEPVVLRMFSGYQSLDYEPAVAYFVKRIDEVSGGAVRIQVINGWGGYRADFERQIVRDLAAGKADLAWVGTRTFDTLGVKSFQALTAPMLIDSYPLEKAVIESDIPRQMLGGLDPLGVTGIGVLADGLRKPIARDAPLLGPADWHGITFSAMRSQGQAEAIRALGAQPSDVWSSPLEDGLDSGEIQGVEKNLQIYQLGTLQTHARYVTANVNLWPQTVALLANPGHLSRLTDDQRGWLGQAAREAAARSTSLFDRDAGIVARTCKTGSRFANASQGDLLGMRSAFESVYTDLEQDPQTKGFIEAIERLKQSTSAGTPLVVPAGCTGVAPGDAPQAQGAPPRELNGTYRWTITKKDALAHGTDADKEEENLATFPWTFTMTLTEGTWTLSHREVVGPFTDAYRRPYSVQDDRITFGRLTFSFAVDGEGNLHVKPILPMDEGDQFVMATHAWTKIAGPRPRAIPDGLYRTNRPEGELLAAGVDPSEAADNDGVLTLAFDRETWTLSRKSDPVENSGTLSYLGGRVWFRWFERGHEYRLSAGWTMESGQLRFTDIQPDDVLWRALWGGEPWKKIR